MIRLVVRMGFATAAAFFAAAPALAQTDQTIVMTCSNQFPGRETYTLNLAARSVTLESVIPNPGGSPDPIRFPAQGTITEISDSQIVWSEGSGSSASVKTLNRYTGDLTWVLLDPQRAANAALAHAATSTSCHRQQKEF